MKIKLNPKCFIIETVKETMYIVLQILPYLTLYKYYLNSEFLTKWFEKPKETHGNIFQNSFTDFWVLYFSNYGELWYPWNKSLQNFRIHQNNPNSFRFHVKMLI